MLLPSQQLSVFFLELLTTMSTSGNFSGQLNAFTPFLKEDLDKKYVESLVFFGKEHEIEPLVTIAGGIPKLISTDSFEPLRFNALGQNDSAQNGFNRKIFFIAVGRLNHKATKFRLRNAFANITGQVRGIFLVTRESIQKHKMNINKNLHDQFQWCWINGFANVVVLMESAKETGKFDIYGYSRFPKLNYFKIAPSTGKTYFPAKFDNLHGYKLRTPIQYDPPRVFWADNDYSKRNKLYGYATKIFMAFLDKHNADYEIVQVRNSSRYNMPGIIRSLREGNVDIAINPYMPDQGASASYPIKMMQWCVVVPFSGEIEAYEYFLRPFRPNTWRAFIIAFFYLSIMKCLIEWLRFPQERRKPKFGRAFMEILRLLLFVPIPTTKLVQKKFLRFVFCFMLITILGFMLSNLYLASLTSYLAKLIFERQIDTIAEIVERKLPIHAIDYEIEIIANNRYLPPGFSKLLVPRTAQSLLSDLFALNADHAYALREDLLSFALFQQNHMLRPKLHIASDCFTTVPISFLIPTHSQVEMVLNDVILRCANAGFTDKWMRFTVTDGYLANILHVRRANKELPALNLRHFQFAWFILLFGLTLAGISFIGENFTRITRRVRIYIAYV